MPVPRRVFLAGLCLAPLTGCATDPTIRGLLPEAAQPTQDPAAAELAAALAALTASIEGQAEPYRSAALEQVAAWQQRLSATDPVAGGDGVFPVPTGQTQEVAAATASAATAAEAAVMAAKDQPGRLLFTSIVLGVTGLSNLGAVPLAAPASPAPYPDTTLDNARGVLLTHIWALIQALERGAGVVATDDPGYAEITARLDEAKQWRNELITVLGDSRPAQDLHYELPQITDAASLMAARATLELAVLAAAAGVVAAGDTASLAQARAQVAVVQAAGGQLPTWPGWLSSSS